MKLKFIEDAVEESFKRLDSVAMHAVLETDMSVESLGLEEFGRVEIVDDTDRTYWKQHEGLYAVMKSDMTGMLAERTRSPSAHCEIKRARLYDVDLPPAIWSQAKAVSYLNSEITARVVCGEFDRLYIQIQGDSVVRLDEMNDLLQSHEMYPVPRLDQLVKLFFPFFVFWFQILIFEF